MNTPVRERTGFVGTLKAALRRRGAAWARRRQGEDRLPVSIAARRVYILPTRAGIAMGLLLFVMLLAGLNYANSIALMITFLLGGFVLIAMHLTHRNLVGVVARGIAAVDAFAGEHGLVLLTLESSGRVRRFAIECEVAGSERVALTLPEEGTARADLAVPLERRGRLLLKRVKLSTAFPYGLFRAWTYLHLEQQILAWPLPRGRREPPAEAATGGDAPSVHRAGDEEWAGLREFRSGDSPRQVAWGVYARGRGLMVKTYQSPAAHHRMFDMAMVPGSAEEKLEQLSAWVVAAHARGERYGLKLGEQEIAPDAGKEHRRRCLDALALHGDSRIAEGAYT
jgi:uncharacterized protein (DUF58 family)